MSLWWNVSEASRSSSTESKGPITASLDWLCGCCCYASDPLLLGCDPRHEAKVWPLTNIMVVTFQWPQPFQQLLLINIATGATLQNRAVEPYMHQNNHAVVVCVKNGRRSQSFWTRAVINSTKLILRGLKWLKYPLFHQKKAKICVENQQNKINVMWQKYFLAVTKTGYFGREVGGDSSCVCGDIARYFKIKHHLFLTLTNWVFALKHRVAPIQS